MFNKRISLILILILTAFLGGCQESSSDKTSENGKLSIYTTVYPLQYFTEQIGGDLVTVKSIYPTGADEHSFEPSQKDMMNLADSDLFFYIGLGLEGFVSKAEQTLMNENVTLVATGENIAFEEHSEENHEEEGTEEDHEHESEDEHNHGDVDPHVWLDPIYSISLAENIKNQLVEELPDHKDELEGNFELLKEKLEDLNEKFIQATSNPLHKEFLVSHAAFGYWEERYGLEQISVSGLTSSNEPTQKELENIIATAKEHNLNYIFFEQNVSSKLTEIVQKEIGAKPLTLHNLSVLQDKDVKEKRTYFSIMEDNIQALQMALNE